MPDPVDLEPDELVVDLEDRAGVAPDVMALVGVLGPAHGEGAGDRIRFHADTNLNRWVEIDRNAIHRRERLPRERGTLPLSVIWVDAQALRQTEFPQRPQRVAMDFLNDRAELWFEPPANMLEAVEYMKMSADYYGGVPMTRRTRYPRWHC